MQSPLIFPLFSGPTKIRWTLFALFDFQISHFDLAVFVHSVFVQPFNFVESVLWVQTSIQYYCCSCVCVCLIFPLQFTRLFCYEKNSFPFLHITTSRHLAKPHKHTNAACLQFPYVHAACTPKISIWYWAASIFPPPFFDIFHITIFSIVSIQRDSVYVWKQFENWSCKRP